MSYFDRIHLLKISLDNAKYLAEFATAAYYNDQIPEETIRVFLPDPSKMYIKE